MTLKNQSLFYHWPITSVVHIALREVCCAQQYSSFADLKFGNSIIYLVSFEIPVGFQIYKHVN